MATQPAVERFELQSRLVGKAESSFFEVSAGLLLKEVATLLDIPVGTVGSRLRRARETFRSIVQRMHGADRHGIRGGFQ